MSTLRYRLTMNNKLNRTVTSVADLRSSTLQTPTVRASRLQGPQRNFAVAVVTNALLTYTSQNYPKIKAEISDILARVVRAEIDYAARAYAKYVPAVPAEPDVPGQLRGTLVSGSAQMDLEEATPEWAPLNARWIRQKNRGRRSNRQKGFFNFTRDMVDYMSSSNNWIEMFGPIQINITRGSVDPLTPEFGSTAEVFSRKVKMSVARIAVKALGNITPGMLPALKDGRTTRDYRDGRATGLLNLVGGVNTQIANKIGNYGAVGDRPYRPSLEPFLTFLLTRSIPTAVFEHVEDELDTQYGLAGPRGRAR